MKKNLLVLVAFCFLFTMTGCGETKTNKAYTFDVDTGDSIRIELDTTDGYDISSDVPFTISLDGETLSQGTFIYAQQYAEYEKVVESTEEAILIESESSDTIEYIFWSYKGEYNYAMIVKDSNTGIIIGNNVSEETARECFERLTITVE